MNSSLQCIVTGYPENTSSEEKADLIEQGFGNAESFVGVGIGRWRAEAGCGIAGLWHGNPDFNRADLWFGPLAASAGGKR